MDGFAKLYKLDRNRNDGGVHIYIRVPSKPFKINNMSSDMESIFLQLNLIKTKKLFSWYCHPPS